MKNKFLNICILIGVISIVAILPSCDPTKNNNKDIIEITEDITSPTIWTSEKTYIIKKYDFYVESTLTIEAGTIIKFSSEAKSLTLLNNGKILANGNASKPIVFTSLKDDSKGGDANNDGTNTSPNVGDWEKIDLNGTQGSVFNYCEFYYGGFGIGASPSLDLSAESEAEITNCVFAYNGGGKNGHYYTGVLNADNASDKTIIKNNLFYANELPLTIIGDINVDNSNSFSKGSLTNKYNGIYVSRDITKNVSWLEDEVAFVISSDALQIKLNASLTLGDNVVLKFSEDSMLDILANESSLINYNGQGVYYTSLKDDELKGDTNGDSNATTPQTADWVGIHINGWKSTGYANWPNIRYNDPNPSVKSTP